MESAPSDSGAAPVVGSVGHILRGAFADLYGSGADAGTSGPVGAGGGNDTSPKGAAQVPGQRNDGYESDELHEVRADTAGARACRKDAWRGMVSESANDSPPPSPW